MFDNILRPVFRKGKSVQKNSPAFYQELEIDVLARTIFGEARGESKKGMEGVASVILNRVAVARAKNGYWWGKDIISVCQKPYQFSCWNRSDPSYQRLQQVDKKNAQFRECLEIAGRAVRGDVVDQTLGATHYHADYVSPYWAHGETPTTKIGPHIFYKLVNI